MKLKALNFFLVILFSSSLFSQQIEAIDFDISNESEEKLSDSINVQILETESQIFNESKHKKNDYFNKNNLPVKKPEKTFEISEKLSSLQIDCNVLDAEIYLNGEYQGLSPVYVSSIAPGTYRLLVHKENYFDFHGLIRSEYGKKKEFYVELKPMTGFLQMQLPENAFFLIDGKNTKTDFEWVDSQTIEIPVGFHSIIVRRFGYQDCESSIYIRKNRIYMMNFEWKPCDFEVKSFSVSSKKFNPMYKGAFGKCAIKIEATSFANGKIFVRNFQDDVVYEKEISIKNWVSEFFWDGTDNFGKNLPLGKYRIELVFDDFFAQKEIELVSDVLFRPLSITNYGSGFGSVPFAINLPDEKFSINFSLYPTIKNNSGFYEIPLELGSVHSFNKNVEGAFKTVVFPSLNDGCFIFALGLKSVFEIPLSKKTETFNFGFGVSYGGMQGHVYEPFGIGKGAGLGTAFMIGINTNSLFAGFTSEWIFGASTSKFSGDNVWKNSIAINYIPNLLMSVGFWLSNNSAFGYYEMESESVRKCERWCRAFESGAAFSVLIPCISSAFRTSYSMSLFDDGTVYHEIMASINLIL